jgi:hypothetical protein
MRASETLSSAETPRALKTWGPMSSAGRSAATGYDVEVNTRMLRMLGELNDVGLRAADRGDQRS